MKNSNKKDIFVARREKTSRPGDTLLQEKASMEDCGFNLSFIKGGLLASCLHVASA